MATWVTPRVWVAGERVSASKMNEISTDLGILFPHTTAGDLAFRSSASADLTRLALTTGGILIGGASLPEYLALGTQRKALFAGASAPQYGPLIEKRKGGNAANWITSGTTTYTPSAPFLQAGAQDVSVNTTGTASVTFPTAYTDNPAVIAVCYGDNGTNTLRLAGISTTGFNIVIKDVDTSGAITVKVIWLAIGE